MIHREHFQEGVVTCGRRLAALLATVALGIFAVPQPAAAEGHAIQYTFTSVNTANYFPYPSSTVIETFQFTAPDFITTDGYVDAPSLNYCSITGQMVTNGVYGSPPCSWVAFLPSHPGSVFPSAQIDLAEYWWIQGSGSGGGEQANYFPPGSFSSVGEYDVVDSNYHYTAHLSVKEVPPLKIPVDSVTLRPLDHFQSFTDRVETQADGFQLDSLFVVTSGAVDPANSSVVLRVGPFFGSIPAGSFAQNSQGYFVYDGTLNGVALQAVIKPLGNSQYTLQAKAQGADLTGSPDPPYVALLIANFVGAAVTPPTVTVSASPSTLWPPNGKTVPVTIFGAITGNGWGVTPASAFFSVEDEYGVVQSSGPVNPGSGGGYSFIIPLQASRLGDDNDGRQYTITVRGIDLGGNLGLDSTVVRVPHDNGH